MMAGLLTISSQHCKNSVDPGAGDFKVNYLAHLYFSAPRPLAWAGSLMGDFFKGSRFGDLPEDLVTHLKLHRRLDTFTLSSSPFQTSRRRLCPSFGHGRSILVDVFYDHFLACQWENYSSQSLPEFSSRVYCGLRDCHRYLPERLQEQLPRMIAGDWLTSYRQEEVVARVLLRLEQRLGHKIPLAKGYEQLHLHRDELEDDFAAFMAAAAGYVELLQGAGIGHREVR